MTIPELEWRTLTTAVNSIKSPNQFVRKMLFSNREAVATNNIDIGLMSKGREIAPFVKENGEGKMVAGYDESIRTVKPTNMRIKRPFTPSELLYGRRVNTAIYVDSGSQLSAVQRHIARDLQVMSDYVTNGEEYLCCMALQGTISYVNEDQDAFNVAFPRSAGHTVTLSTFWDDATPANVRMEADFFLAKKLLSDAEGLTVTDAIFGEEATATFQELVATGVVKVLDQRHVMAGEVTFIEQFNDDGAIYLGKVFGVRCWAYIRTALVNGVSTSMIRSKYVEFVSVSPTSDRIIYYGSIPDMKLLRGGSVVAERFSKSWEIEDPSSMMSLLHSRPIPVPRKPDATVSMKVVSG